MFRNRMLFLVMACFFFETSSLAGPYGIELPSLSTSKEVAQRLVGESYYSLGEYSKAIETWEAMLLSLSTKQIAERKKTINSIALAYIALLQNSQALAKIEEGLRLQYSEKIDTERREQSRLLSTKASIELSSNLCSEASTTWDSKNILGYQETSKCRSLINAQVLSCSTSADNKGEIIDSLFIGVGQDPSSFRDNKPEALSAIIRQAEQMFKDCYLGLRFNSNNVKRAVTN